jgi:hypothetical protein
MIMRWFINGLLLALVVGLSSAIQRDLSIARTPPTLSDLVAADLLLIEIVREGEPTITLGRSPSGWRMEAPYQLDANAEQVNRLLAILATPVSRSLPEESTARDQLGLTAPKIRLRLNTLEFAFGGIDPLAQHRYVASEGLVHLIDDRVYPALIAPPLAYLSRQLLPREVAQTVGQINGVPLAAEALAALTGVVAERLEVVTNLPPELTPVEVRSADGTQVQFAVSADRRRWWRALAVNPALQLAAASSAPAPTLLYVLTTAPNVTVDPSAPNPPVLNPPNPPISNPPNPPFSKGGFDGDSFSKGGVTESPFSQSGVTESPFSQSGVTESQSGNAEEVDAVVTDDLPPTPPAVRLTRDGVKQPVADAAAPRQLHGEPDKPAPRGFGDDPFAPEPAAAPAAAPFR